MSHLGVITGLAAEAAIATSAAGNRRVTVVCAGASSARAERLAEDLVAGGADALLSFGIAGGLEPDLKPGDVVLPVAVRDGAADHPTDAAWHARVSREIAARAGLLVGSDRVVPHPGEKRARRAATGAAAVDMESHAVARVARRHGVPFLVLRVISDGAHGRLPRAALHGVATDGRARPGAVAARLALAPWQLPALLRLRRDSARAFRRLGRVARDAPALFGPFDL